MMARSLFVCLALGWACAVRAAPLLGFNEDLEDSAIVESTVREVRALKPLDLEPAPANFHKSYGSGDKGDIGYTRQKADKGQLGYQKFDSFHKKGGDSYGYEKHDSFGLDEKSGTDHHRDKADYKQKKDDGKKAEYREAPEDESYEVVEESDGDAEEADDEGEGSREESSDDGNSKEDDGNSGSGHDEADAANYENPESYSYGSGSEYDF